MSRSKPWIITIRVEPEEIDSVRQANASHFARDWHDVTRNDIHHWFHSIIRGELESVYSTMEDYDETIDDEEDAD